MTFWQSSLFRAIGSCSSILCLGRLSPRCQCTSKVGQYNPLAQQSIGVYRQLLNQYFPTVSIRCSEPLVCSDICHKLPPGRAKQFLCGIACRLLMDTAMSLGMRRNRCGKEWATGNEVADSSSWRNRAGRPLHFAPSPPTSSAWHCHVGMGILSWRPSAEKAQQNKMLLHLCR